MKYNITEGMKQLKAARKLLLIVLFINVYDYINDVQQILAVNFQMYGLKKFLQKDDSCLTM